MLSVYETPTEQPTSQNDLRYTGGRDGRRQIVAVAAAVVADATAGVDSVHRRLMATAQQTADEVVGTAQFVGGLLLLLRLLDILLVNRMLWLLLRHCAVEMIHIDEILVERKL